MARTWMKHSDVDIKFSRTFQHTDITSGTFKVTKIMYYNSRTFGIRTNPDHTSKLSAQINRQLLVWTTTYLTAPVAEWLRAWDTLTMFEATVCGRS